MKEIHIPSQPEREGRERGRNKPPTSLLDVIVRASYTAVIIAVISFFALTAIAIAAMAIYAAFAPALPDFAKAYRYVGAPGAAAMLVGVWIYSFVAFRRQYRRAAGER